MKKKDPGAIKERAEMLALARKNQVPLWGKDTFQPA